MDTLDTMSFPVLKAEEIAATATSIVASIASPFQQPQVNLERMPISIVPRHTPQSSSLNPSTSTNSLLNRTAGISKGKPKMIESPSTSSSPEKHFLGGAKKRRGERGPDKNPNIDPRTGKRRYIKRKSKRFGLIGDKEVLGDDARRGRKKNVCTSSRYYVSNSGIPRIRIRGIRPRHYRRHPHHQQSPHKFSDYYLTPLRRKREDDSDDDEEESDLYISSWDSWEDISSEDVEDTVWRPTDDLRLIVNVLQTNDLKMVHVGTKFSCYFTLENIEARWEYLLYDKPMAKVSQNAIRNLPGIVKSSIYAEALFSVKENNILKKISSTSEPKTLMPIMKKLIDDNPGTFFKWRTAKHLRLQWMHLRDFYLLSDQNVKGYFQQKRFADFESTVCDSDLLNEQPVDDAVTQEKLIQRKINRKRIRKLEQEVIYWQAVSEICTEIVPRMFEDGSVAMLRGRQVRYLMRSKEITLGRRTEDNKVDADLSLEGSTYKISRRQATVQLRNNCEFVIVNQGKHAIYLNGRPVFPKSIGTLRDNAVIEISLLSFVFLINHKMIRELQRKQLMQSAIQRESVIHRHSSGGPTSKTKYFPPSYFPQVLQPQIPYYPIQSSSSPLSLSSILSPTFSNTLPALNISTNRKPPNNSKSPTTPKSMPKLNKKSSVNNIIGTTASASSGVNFVGNIYRPSWYLEPQSQSQPPPLTTISKTNSPLRSYLPCSFFSPINPSTYRQQYSSIISPYLNPTATTTTSTLPRSIMKTSPTSSVINAAPILISPSSSPADPTKAVASSIQFGDITIRPGIPPPTEATTLNNLKS